MSRFVEPAQCRYLSFAEREEIALLLCGQGRAQIAQALGRSPSTISRNCGGTPHFSRRQARLPSLGCSVEAELFARRPENWRPS
ncbi:helix-turn-helix domain-containing protein [Nocardia seriolae]|uniref:helix-turn-helix domain-containing protein n=1 Tax=Nocardia seriolae TaxID=37332 RepID=UPI001881B47D|nr:helix-turn-helix domain-containing protein [Nocardia seriolae]